MVIVYPDKVVTLDIAGDYLGEFPVHGLISIPVYRIEIAVGLQIMKQRP